MWDLTVPGNNDHDFYIQTADIAVLVHNCKVEYGSTPLSQAVQDARIAAKDMGGNYAAGALEDGTILIGRSSAEQHAEDDVIEQAAGRRITDIYSEREPCSFKCAATQDMNPTWSWPWNPATVRAGANAAVRAAVRGAIPVSRRSLVCESYIFAEPVSLREVVADAPQIQHALFVAGIPKGFIGRRYQSDPAVSILELPGHGRILRFGTAVLAAAIGVELATGHVVAVLNVPIPVPLFTNTSIDQFTQTVKEVISRFPYYDQDATYDEIDGVAQELLNIIKRIDPEAAIPDRYWSTFVDDVAIGDLSTEAILEIAKKRNEG